MNEEVLFTGTQMVAVTELKPYGKNPRKGNVRAIAESLASNKQYRPIVVQKSTRQILAGNHTWQAAKLLGWSKIAVVYVDVNDDEAKKIVLADNRTNDLAEYDNKILAELLRDLQSPQGTGYSQDDMDSLLRIIEDSAEEAFAVSHQSAEDALKEDDPLLDLPTGPLFTSDDDDDDDDYGKPESMSGEDVGTDITRSADDLSGVYSLKDDMVFPTKTYWEIPALREDMLITELPEPLHTWAGSATRDLGWDGYWLYNWGIDSTSGMTDLSKVMLSFYAWDEYFENWWHYPSRHLSKVINHKIKYAITPNFTQGGMARSLALYNLYRSRWVGRYLQEVGVRVMPDLESREEPEMTDIFVASLPKELPWASIQIQNFTAKSKTGNSPDEEHVKNHFAHARLIVQKCNVQNLLVYSHPNMWERIQEEFAPTGVHVRPIETRLYFLSQRARKKADTEL